MTIMGTRKKRTALIYNLADAKARLSSIVREVLAGDEVIIAKDNKPLVRIVPLRGDQSRLYSRLGEGPAHDGCRLRRATRGLLRLLLMRVLLDTHAFLWFVAGD